MTCETSAHKNEVPHVLLNVLLRCKSKIEIWAVTNTQAQHEKKVRNHFFLPKKSPHSQAIATYILSPLGHCYYRKRGSASYIVREVHSVRERDTEREREREKDGSDVTIVALKLAMSFALLLAKNVHLSIGEEFCAFPSQKICTSVSPLLNGAEFTLSVAKNVALFETVRILRTIKWRD